MLVTGELRELSCLSVLPAPLHIPPERVQTNLFATCQCAISDPPPFLFPFLPMFLFLKAPLGREEAIWVDGISPLGRGGRVLEKGRRILNSDLCVLSKPEMQTPTHCCWREYASQMRDCARSWHSGVCSSLSSATLRVFPFKFRTRVMVLMSLGPEGLLLQRCVLSLL